MMFFIDKTNIQQRLKFTISMLQIFSNTYNLVRAFIFELKLC